jgi:hypothetical protein
MLKKKLFQLLVDPEADGTDQLSNHLLFQNPNQSKNLRLTPKNKWHSSSKRNLC